MTDDANMPFGYAASTGGAHAPQADVLMSGACLKLPGHTCILPVDITGFVDIFWGYRERPPKSLSNYTQIITGFGCYRDSNLDDLGHDLGRIWAYRERPYCSCTLTFVHCMCPHLYYFLALFISFPFVLVTEHILPQCARKPLAIMLSIRTEIERSQCATFWRYLQRLYLQWLKSEMSNCPSGIHTIRHYEEPQTVTASEDSQTSSPASKPHFPPHLPQIPHA